MKLTLERGRMVIEAENEADRAYLLSLGFVLHFRDNPPGVRYAANMRATAHNMECFSCDPLPPNTGGIMLSLEPIGPAHF